MKHQLDDQENFIRFLVSLMDRQTEAYKQVLDIHRLELINLSLMDRQIETDKQILDGQTDLSW